MIWVPDYQLVVHGKRVRSRTFCRRLSPSHATPLPRRATECTPANGAALPCAATADGWFDRRPCDAIAVRRSNGALIVHVGGNAATLERMSER